MAKLFDKVYWKENIGKILPLKSIVYKSKRKTKIYKLNKVTEDILEESPANINYIARKILIFCNSSDKILKSDFKLNHLAKEIGTNRNYISKAINNILSTNYSQLRNFYRIKKACSIFINNPKISTNKLWQLSDFSSSSSFLIAFEKYVGTSPSKWYKEVRSKKNKGERININEYIKDIHLTIEETNYQREKNSP